MKKSKSLKRSVAGICILLCAVFVFSGCSAANMSPEGGYYDNMGSIINMQENGDNFEGENTESYTSIAENTFIATSYNPISTFSADVDTASYCNLRRMINAGMKIGQIPSSAIRTEEIVNYFSYNYATPKDGEPFGVSAGISACPWNAKTKLLVLGLTTNKVDYAQTPASNLVFLIDVSGSMDSDDKLGLLKSSLKYLVSQLDETDRISIVTYSGAEKVLLEGESGDNSSKIKSAINKLSASGSTNGEAGIKKAYELARQYFIADGNNRIILASDGDLNVGISSPEELKALVETERKSGVYLSVLGFGTGNYKDNNMEALANNGNGNYYYIDCLEEAQKVFGEDLTATMLTVADDVKLQLEFNPVFVDGYRLIGYENRMLTTEDFEDDTKDAGEVGTGHTVTAVYEIIPKGAGVTIPTPDPKINPAGEAIKADFEADEWLSLAIRYKDPGESESKQLDFSVGTTNVTDAPNDDFKFITAAVELSMILRDSAYKGNLTLRDVLDTLDGTTLNDKYKLEFKELVEKLND